MASAIERLRQSTRNSRARYGEIIAKREHTLFSTAAAAGLGVAEARGHKLPQFLGMDGTLTVGVGALLASNAVGGNAGRMLQSLADAMLAIGSYNLGKTVGAQPAVKGIGEANAMDALLSAA